MTIIEISDTLKKSLVKLVVINQKTGNVISQGSGVVIDANGFVLTANHVVALALNEQSYIIVGIPYTGSGRIFYSYFFGGIQFSIGQQEMVSPMKVDLAILRPLQPNSLPPVILEDIIPKEGTEVIMAGFPEDLKTPLDFADKFNKQSVGGEKGIEIIRQFSYSIIPWLMLKHGIIGGVSHIFMENTMTELLGPSTPLSLRAAEYWIDNTYAKGASGGPVVNREGNLLGIITEVGETTVSDFSETISFPVPSGSTRVLSHKLITWSIDKLKERLNSKTDNVHNR